MKMTRNNQGFKEFFYRKMQDFGNFSTGNCWISGIFYRKMQDFRNFSTGNCRITGIFYRKMQDFTNFSTGKFRILGIFYRKLPAKCAVLVFKHISWSLQKWFSAWTPRKVGKYDVVKRHICGEKDCLNGIWREAVNLTALY